MKLKERLDLSSPKMQIPLGILAAVMSCALKTYCGVALNESLIDVVVVQSIILSFMCVMELAMALVCKFEDFRDEDEKLLICGVFGIGAATLSVGLMMQYNIFAYVWVAFAVPCALIFGNKFYFKYFTATLTLMSLFIVAWQ